MGIGGYDPTAESDWEWKPCVATANEIAPWHHGTLGRLHRIGKFRLRLQVCVEPDLPLMEKKAPLDPDTCLPLIQQSSFLVDFGRIRSWSQPQHHPRN